MWVSYMANNYFIFCPYCKAEMKSDPLPHGLFDHRRTVAEEKVLSDTKEALLSRWKQENEPS